MVWASSQDGILRAEGRQVLGLVGGVPNHSAWRKRRRGGGEEGRGRREEEEGGGRGKG